MAIIAHVAGRTARLSCRENGGLLALVGVCESGAASADKEAHVAEVLRITKRSSPMALPTARNCGAPTKACRWLEFTPVDGDPVLRSKRETTQPNRGIYWATGLTPVYLEGALQRTLHPRGRTAVPVVSAPAFDGPAPEIDGPRPSHPILDPFAVIRRGEPHLRRQLEAISDWHLVSIVRGYGLSSLAESQLSTMSGPALVELIVGAVNEEAPTPSKR